MINGENQLIVQNNALGSETEVSEKELRKLFAEDNNIKKFVETVHGQFRHVHGTCDNCPKMNGTR